jgi:phospholipid/cholesterol/gamma-HCH transport system permease protein
LTLTLRLYLRDLILSLLTPPWRWSDALRLTAQIANGSLLTICFCVTAAAMVTILEASFHMKLVIQNDALVPGFAALLILRELGSVVMALLITSKVGAGLAAEVGTMKITEQIDALRLLGFDPIRFLVVPRFVACLVAGFFLAIIANLVCLTGAVFVSVFELGYSPGAFLSAMRVFVGFQDLVFAAIKGACFGAVIPIISCWYGLRCEAGAEGVGRATTQSVVVSSISIIGINFVLSWIFSGFY